jgi:hypothetical protein
MLLKQKAKTTVIFLVIWLCCFCPKGAMVSAQNNPMYPEPAALFLVPEKDKFLDPDYLYINIYSDTASTTVNAWLLGLDYDPARVELASVSPATGSCELMIFQHIDHDSGQLSLACGQPEGFSGQQILARLVFSKLEKGEAILDFSGYSAFKAADGLGTDVPLLSERHVVEIK